MKTVSGFVVENWKHWFEDLNMIGRHFLVYSKQDILIKRQYTICCSIVPKVYKQLLALCDAKLNGDNEHVFDVELLNKENKNSIHVTCKDYKTKKGVATKLHN